MHTGLRIAALACALVALAGACAEEFDAPSAYESQIYLCDADHAAEWGDTVAACRADFDRDRSCAGVVSLTGTVYGTAVTFGGTLDGAAFENLRRLDGTIVRRRISLDGASPYFTYRLEYKSLGGATDAGDVTKMFAIAANPDPLADEYEDAYVTASLRTASAGRSDDLVCLGGALESNRQLPDEQAGTFFGAYGTSDDFVEGCFHAFATSVSVSDEREE